MALAAPCALGRLLSLTDGGDEPTLPRLESFCSFIVVESAIHAFVTHNDWRERSLLLPDGWVVVAHAGLVMVCLLWPLLKSNRRLLLGCTLALVVYRVIGLFPRAHNHLYLELLALSALNFFRLEIPDERRACIGFLRWLVVIVLFYSGLQKLCFGTYFNATYLGKLIASSERFRAFFRYLLSEGELARLVAMGGRPGTGPYRIDEPLLVVASNLVWIGEMVTGVLLLTRRLRPLGLVLALALVVAIELGAREVVFGVLMGNLILCFGPARWSRLAATVSVPTLILAAVFGSAFPSLEIN